ncbi:24625_t:CDS:2, partial [Dentiscutata erythropus]
ISSLCDPFRILEFKKTKRTTKTINLLIRSQSSHSTSQQYAVNNIQAEVQADVQADTQADMQADIDDHQDDYPNIT